jgi:type I restriction enzyme S subunit
MENRYDKYKDSGIAWIGEIPEHWEVCSIKQIMKNKSIKGFPNETVLSLYRDFGIIPKDSRDDNHNVTSEDTSNYKLVENGDFVINKMKAWQGSMAISDFKGIISPAYYICKIFSPKVVRKYIHYLLRDESYKAEYMRLSTGMRIGQWDLNIDDFLQINTILPLLSEQQSIATYLDQKCGEIDELITLQEEMITKLQSYKQSVITEAVTKGLDKNVPLKDSGIEWIGEIPEHWSVVKIKYLAKIKSGDSISSNEIMQEGIYEVYGGNGLMGFCNKKNVDGVNIIIGRVGALCGNVRLISESKFITDNALILNCFDNALYSYMYIMLKAANLNNLNTSNAQPLITGSKVLNVSLPIPPLSEQQSIADYLDQKCSEIDELISIKQQKIEKLKDYKKSLIFECVTGKRKV